MKSIDNQHNPRLAHLLNYAKVRAIELDLGMQSNSLTFNHFDQSMLLDGGEKIPQGGGYDMIFPPTKLPTKKSQPTDKKRPQSDPKNTPFSHNVYEQIEFLAEFRKELILRYLRVLTLKGEMLKKAGSEQNSKSESVDNE